MSQMIRSGGRSGWGATTASLHRCIADAIEGKTVCYATVTSEHAKRLCYFANSLLGMFPRQATDDTIRVGHRDGSIHFTWPGKKTTGLRFDVEREDHAVEDLKLSRRLEAWQKDPEVQRIGQSMTPKEKR